MSSQSSFAWWTMEIIEMIIEVIAVPTAEAVSYGVMNRHEMAAQLQTTVRAS